MVVQMDPFIRQEHLDAVLDLAHHLNAVAHVSKGRHRVLVGIPLAVSDVDSAGRRFQELTGVTSVFPVSRSFQFVSSESCHGRTTVQISERVVFGGDEVVVCAGPCSVESEEQIRETAAAVARSGATVLRGGAFKPRSSPYSFQGLGEVGLSLLRQAADENGLAVVTEVVSVRDVDLVAQYADMMQIGARNMQNFTLLREVGQSGKPVLLKRGMSATLDEWLMAAEYICAEGNHDIVLCERGIRGFDRHTRNVLDLAAIPILRQLTHLPVIVDPSHGTGVRSAIAPMSAAALAAGADGLIIEVHPNPAAALSDGEQSLSLEQFEELTSKCSSLAHSLGRSWGVVICQ